MALVLRSPSDWRKADNVAITWETENEVVYEMARHRIGRVRMTHA